MTPMIAAASLVMLLAGAPATAKAPAKTAPTPASAEPAITVTVPAACADVRKSVYTDFDASWKVTVLAPTKEDESTPQPEVLDAFLARVPGLADAVAKFDALDRDILFIRLQTKPLADLVKQYPKIKRSVLEAAKTDRCRNAAGK